MPGPKYNYLNVRDDLRVGESGSGQITFRDGDIKIYSDSDTNLTIQADGGITFDSDVDVAGSHSFTTSTGTSVVRGDMTITSGDLTRRSTKYISGVSAILTPTGYTRATNWLEIIDDGTAILSAKSGNLEVKLPKSPVIGNMVTVVCIHSGARAKSSCKLSGSSIRVASKNHNNVPYNYIRFDNNGQAVTLVNDGNSYYFAHPSSTNGGPTLTTTYAGG